MLYSEYEIYSTVVQCFTYDLTDLKLRTVLYWSMYKSGKFPRSKLGGLQPLFTLGLEKSPVGFRAPFVERVKGVN